MDGPAAPRPPRGIVNHNPGNIRLSGQAWLGKVPNQQNTDGAFEQFAAPEYGIRAMCRIFRAYRAAGWTTVRAMIERWAPPNENDTGAYVRFVCAQAGVGPDDAVDPKRRSVVEPLCRAIVTMENGQAWRDHYSKDVFDRAFALAGVA